MRISFAIMCLSGWLLVSTASAQSVGPSNGTLLIVGGGRMGKEIVQEFIDRAGGIDSPFVLVPGANSGEDWDEKYVAKSFLARAGAKDIAVLHTRDRAVADSDDFIAPLRRAKGVWIDGGRQWRLADSYLDTRTHRELFCVLNRGGVIGGSSAGATIQGSYLVRGAPEGNTVMMAKGHEIGFGFMNCTAIDQHVIARKRQNDLAEVLDTYPGLLGIGIDEGTAIVVTGRRFKVIGASQVVIHDRYWPKPVDQKYELLSPGDEFDLCCRRKVEKVPGP
ncbi:MAG: peptidase S51 [Planctomycetes bacterium]|nr:peptidase S51 [Planctomycetota bacterium]